MTRNRVLRYAAPVAAAVSAVAAVATLAAGRRRGRIVTLAARMAALRRA